MVKSHGFGAGDGTWTHEPADYESAALPTELLQHITINSVLKTNITACLVYYTTYFTKFQVLDKDFFVGEAFPHKHKTLSK